MNDFLQSLRNGQAEKPRTPKTRKNYDNSYHYTSQPRYHSYGGYQSNRNQQMKRPPMPHPQGNQAPATDDSAVTSMLAEAVESLSRHIENLAKNQDYLVSVHERMADMLERQAIAIERIVDHLNISPAADPSDHDALEHHYVTSAAPEPEELPVDEIETPVQSSKTADYEKPAKPVIRRRKKIVPQKTTPAMSENTELLSREAIMDIIYTMRNDGATYDQVAHRLIELGQPTFSGRGEWHAQTIHRLCSKK